MKKKEKHFDYTSEIKTNAFGAIMHLIRCTRPVRNVKAGDLGGWVQSMKNLLDDAWIYDEAEVFGSAIVTDNVEMSGNSIITGNASVHYSEISGSAKVYGHAKIYNEKLLRSEQVFEDATLSAVVGY